MKKVIAIFVGLALVFTFFACSNQNTESTENNEEKSTDTTNATDNTSNNLTQGDTTQAQEQAQTQTEVQTEEKKAVVIYFSCTGKTERIAEIIAQGVNGDLHEIIPKIPYTATDLNYNDNNSRSTSEMNDKAFRPEIANSIDNIAKYDTIYLGYPIWWGEAPRILSTFIESHNFDNKTIIPFCTSGGSGIGSSDKQLKALSNGGEWLEGRRFSGSESAESVMNWVNDLSTGF